MSEEILIRQGAPALAGIKTGSLFPCPCEDHEALMTDIGFTGGGAGNGMVYLAGKQSHRMGNDQMIDHIVELVEKKAAEIEAQSKEAAE